MPLESDAKKAIIEEYATHPGDTGSPEVQVAMLTQAEGFVTSKLATKFSTPFSSNNITAKNLTIDMVYVQTQMTRQPDKANALKEFVMEQIGDLLTGNATMVTDAGVQLALETGDPVWSSTENYHPVFGMSDVVESAVSSAQQIAEDNARGVYPGAAS